MRSLLAIACLIASAALSTPANADVCIHGEIVEHSTGPYRGDDGCGHLYSIEAIFPEEFRAFVNDGSWIATPEPLYAEAMKADSRPVAFDLSMRLTKADFVVASRTAFGSVPRALSEITSGLRKVVCNLPTLRKHLGQGGSVNYRLLTEDMEEVLLVQITDCTYASRYRSLYWSFL